MTLVQQNYVIKNLKEFDNKFKDFLKNLNLMIDGVKITSLKIISDNRGSVMHMMRKDSPVYKSW